MTCIFCQSCSTYENNRFKHLSSTQKTCLEKKLNRQSQFPKCRITECGKYAFCPGIGVYINGKLQGQQNDGADEYE